MNKIGQISCLSQNRIVKLFKEQLGFTYYGN
jgi:type I restriction enzyme R subunit